MYQLVSKIIDFLFCSKFFNDYNIFSNHVALNEVTDSQNI